jgi:toxin-antitoxin system PIN domain toxin
VIVLDANLLLYAYDPGSSHYKAARKWVEQAFSGSETLGIPWQTAGAFLRIVTNSTLPGQRVTLDRAVEVVDQWMEQPNVRMLTPGERHWPLLRQMMTAGQARGPLLTDAQLAALTIEHGGVLHTSDRDFARFPGLRSTNPLA